MDTLSTYDDLLASVSRRFEIAEITTAVPRVRMLGIMFARPNSQFAKLEITPQIADWHYRSGEHIDFYFAGYSTGSSMTSAESIEVPIPGKETWFYSPRDFELFRRQFEASSSWRYGGGCELLLVNARWSFLTGANIDFSSAVCCSLDLMKEHGAIPSVERFLESLFRFAETTEASSDPTWGFSDSKGIEVAGSALTNVVLGLLPKGLGSEYKKVKHFAVRDVSKK